MVCIFSSSPYVSRFLFSRPFSVSHRVVDRRNCQGHKAPQRARLPVGDGEEAATRGVVETAFFRGRGEKKEKSFASASCRRRSSFLPQTKHSYHCGSPNSSPLTPRKKLNRETIRRAVAGSACERTLTMPFAIVMTNPSPAQRPPPDGSEVDPLFSCAESAVLSAR